MSRIQHPKVTGMTKCEREIMDLWDAGFSTRQIAERLGRAVSTVTAVVSNLSTNDLERSDRAIRSQMAAGSSALLAAIQQERRA